MAKKTKGGKNHKAERQELLIRKIKLGLCKKPTEVRKNK